IGIPKGHPRWTAGERGRMEVEIVEVGFKGRTIKVPVWIQPGHADDSATLYLGYGRDHAGKVGSKIGANAYKIRTSDSLWIGAGVDIKKTDDTTFIANTQAYFSMQGRKPIRKMDVATYLDAKKLSEAMAPAAA